MSDVESLFNIQLRGSKAAKKPLKLDLVVLAREAR